MRELFIEFAEKKENRELYFNKLAEKIQEGDARIITWFGDQLLGKAPAQIDYTGSLAIENFSEMVTGIYESIETEKNARGNEG